MKGIDVSTYQGYPDWKKVRADGVEFALIKATQGRAESSEAYLFRDSKFIYNLTNAAVSGISCGVYHYFTAQTPEECDREAGFFLSQLQPYREYITLFAAIDVESKYLRGLSKKDLTGLVRRFCTAVEAAGYRPIVYTNPDWLKNRLECLCEYPLWLALWRPKQLKPTGYDNLAIWQWGASTVDGITGKVDTNVGYFELPAEPESNTGPVHALPVPAPRETLRIGDEVRIERPVLYGTKKKFLTKFRTYTVEEIDGERVTVSHFGQWRVSVHIDSVEKV